MLPAHQQHGRGRRGAEPDRRHPGPPGPRPRHRQRGPERRPARRAATRSANGPFPPGVIGHLDDTGYPDLRPRRAPGPRSTRSRPSTGGPVAIAYKTTNDPFNLTTAELLQQMWQDVGFEVTIDQIPQGEFINQALGRQLPGLRLAQPRRRRPRPAVRLVELDDDPGHRPELRPDHLRRRRLAARHDPDLTDEAERQAAAEDLNRLFAENVYNVWNNWVLLGPRPRRQRLQRRRRVDPRRP